MSNPALRGAGGHVPEVAVLLAPVGVPSGEAVVSAADEPRAYDALEDRETESITATRQPLITAAQHTSINASHDHDYDYEAIENIVPHNPDHEETGPVLPPLRRIAIAVMPIFMGYAVLVSLQEKLRSHLGINDNHSEAAQTFESGVSLIFVGDLIFRLTHNVFLTFLRPRQRVIFAYVAMASSMTLIVFLFYAAHVKNLAWVYVAYFVGGIGLGTYETNIMSCVTPLGHNTKQWAVLGMPLGYNGISIGAFALFAVWPTSESLQLSLFVTVAALNVVGALVFIFGIPDVPFEASEDSFTKFWRDCRYHFREWLPRIWHFLVVMFLNMFSVILMTGVVLYIFKEDVELIPGQPGSKVSKNVFQAIYNTCAFLGDFTSRRIMYRYVKRRLHPALFIILSAIGLGCGLCRIGLLAWLGMFLVMFGNGGLYATTAKHFDDRVPHQFNLVVFSVWLFVGDCGSFTASYTTDYIAALVG